MEILRLYIISIASTIHKTISGEALDKGSCIGVPTLHLHRTFDKLPNGNRMSLSLKMDNSDPFSIEVQ